VSHESVCMTAFWQAIDNFADTASVFGLTTHTGQSYRFNGSMPQQLSAEADPLAPAFPSLLVFPVARDPEWHVHRQMANMVTLEIRLYTKMWQYDQAADLINKVRRACYQAPTNLIDSYIKTATGFIPVKFGPIKYTPIAIGDSKNLQALRTTALLLLQTRDDPMAIA
jgi:hypothetical protein